MEPANEKKPTTKLHQLAVPYPIRQADCGWVGLMEWEGNLYAYFSTRASAQLVRAEFVRPISYRATEEIPAVMMWNVKLHENGMSPDGFAYEITNGEFAEQVSGSGILKAVYPTAKHYLLMTGDTELEVICTRPPTFSMVSPSSTPDALLNENLR